jgi:hypothetical protein
VRRTVKRISALKEQARLQGFTLERTKRGWRVTDLATGAVVCDGYSLAEVEGFLSMPSR